MGKWFLHTPPSKQNPSTVYKTKGYVSQVSLEG